MSWKENRVRKTKKLRIVVFGKIQEKTRERMKEVLPVKNLEEKNMINRLNAWRNPKWKEFSRIRRNTNCQVIVKMMGSSQRVIGMQVESFTICTT